MGPRNKGSKQGSGKVRTGKGKGKGKGGKRGKQANPIGNIGSQRQYVQIC